jgi:hypothetical protein
VIHHHIGIWYKGNAARVRLILLAGMGLWGHGYPNWLVSVLGNTFLGITANTGLASVCRGAISRWYR